MICINNAKHRRCRTGQHMIGPLRICLT